MADYRIPVLRLIAIIAFIGGIALIFAGLVFGAGCKKQHAPGDPVEAEEEDPRADEHCVEACTMSKHARCYDLTVVTETDYHAAPSVWFTYECCCGPDKNVRRSELTQ